MTCSDEAWFDFEIEDPGNWIFSWAEDFAISRGAIFSLLQSGLTRLQYNIYSVFIVRDETIFIALHLDLKVIVRISFCGDNFW